MPVLSPSAEREDLSYEVGVRPRTLAEFVGQEELKRNLAVFIEAARGRGEPLDHVLIHGHPGLGKTTLAQIVANELGSGFKATSGPALERPGDLAAILTNLQEGDVFFVDEIHRLGRVVEELLYPAMEDFRLDIVVGQGPSARTIKLELPHFTLVGATTRAGLLTPPLRDRFGVQLRVDFYGTEELSRIVSRCAGVLECAVEPGGATEIARRSRGTPRITLRLLRRVRDFAQVKGAPVITRQVADEALAMLEVDRLGFDSMDRKILLTLIDKFDGGPVGVETLSHAVCEERDTIEDVYEPFLIQGGYLHRTPRGRVATRLAYEHFGKLPPEGATQSEFFNARGAKPA